MSLKKRLFQSNMLFLFLALVSMLLVGAGVVMIFEDSFEKMFETPEMEAALRQSYLLFILIFLLIGMGVIVVLLVLATLFTRKMTNMVMEPLEQLSAGAKRVKEGNLKEDVIYAGEQEFEQVCQTFNEMQKAILDSKRQQEKNEQARIDMVTGISHDLRTPLTSIQGYIKGVMDGIANTPEKQKVYLETAYNSTKEMNTLLQKLFDFSRMESGQMPFHMVKIDLIEYVQMYVAQKEAVLDLSEVQFVMESENVWMSESDSLAENSSLPERIHLPEIMVDVEQLRRILDNLLENSRKYSGRIPVEIWIRVREEEDFLVLEWKDHGQGVPEEKLSKIFDRFYRCDEARGEKGSGVGLYVVKYIMEQHGGCVSAENDQGLMIQLHFPKESALNE